MLGYCFPGTAFWTGYCFLDTACFYTDIAIQLTICPAMHTGRANQASIIADSLELPYWPGASPAWPFAGPRSEERRVGKECVSVDLGGRRILNKKNSTNKSSSHQQTTHPHQH